MAVHNGGRRDARGFGRFLWTVHGDGRHLAPTEVVAPEERLAWGRTIGIGVQHIIAMFGATFVVPVLTGFPPTTTIMFSGIGTLVFIAATRGRGQILGLPSYTGSSFAFISPVIAAETHNHGGIPAALGGIFAAGALFFIIGLLVDHYGPRPVNAVMPPVVTGAVVALIGLNLAPVATGDIQKQGYTAFVTLGAILLITVLLRGFVGRISILLGVVVGYLFAWPMGQLVGDQGANGKGLSYNWHHASWFGHPPFHTPSFGWDGVSLMLPVVIVLLAENTGHVKAVGTMTGRNYDASLGRAYMGDGAASMISGLFGGSGTTTYAENIGVMAATKVYSTAAYIVAGVAAIGLGFIPKLGAIIVSIPVGVLGGATILLYGLIAVLGGRIWVENRVDFKNPINLFPAAVGIIAGAGNYTWTHGNVSFNGIAIGAVATIVAYHAMNFVATYGPLKGQLSPAEEVPTPAAAAVPGTGGPAPAPAERVEPRPY